MASHAEQKVCPAIYQLLLNGAPTGVLSTSQRQFVRFAGYPQVVTKTFSIANGKKRVDEVWSYTELGVKEVFINGFLVEESQFALSSCSVPL